MSTFTKFDGEKPMMSLITPVFANMLLDLYKPQIAADYSAIDLARQLYDDEYWQYKIRDALSLIVNWYPSPAHMLEAVANVLTFGAAKYERHNWKKCEEIWRYEDAVHRHMLALLKGETHDEESGLHHMDHVLCNLMFLEYFS